MKRESSPPTVADESTGPIAILPRRRSPGFSRSAERSELSRASHVPLYYQLAVILEERTESGDYAPGEEFPSEQELCREFGVSRTVVRPAIAILEREGRVARSKGKRTIVEPPKTVHRLGGLLRVLLESAAGKGLEVRILDVGRETGAPETAALLGLERGESLLRLAVVTKLADVPTAIHWSFLAERDFPWIVELKTGQQLTGREPELRQLSLGRAEIVVESSWCTEFEASELAIPIGSPLLVARSIEYRTGGSHVATPALEVCWTIYPASSGRWSGVLGPVEAPPREGRPRSSGRAASRGRWGTE